MGTGEYLINVIGSVIAVAYMDRGFEKKYDGCKRWLCFAAGGIAYFIVLTVFNHIILYEGVLCLFYGGVLVAYGAFALEGCFSDKIMLGLMWILVVLFGTFIVYGAMGFLVDISVQDMAVESGWLHFCAALAACAVKMFMGRIVVRFYSRREGIRGKEDWLIVGVLMLVLFTGLEMFRLELGSMGGKARYGLLTLLLAGQFGGVLLLERIYHRLGEYQRARMEAEYRSEIAEFTEKIQRKDMMDIYRIGREINHWRHDMKGTLEILYRLQNKGQYETVTEKLAQVCGELRSYPELPQDTGNEGLNAALMKAVARCTDGEILFSYVVIGNPGWMDSSDMGILMWNLFANGIEACTSAEEPAMDVVIREEGGRIEIRLENSISGSVLTDNPGLCSSKEDKLHHGFGMETVYGMLQKYRGGYVCWEESGRFIQELCLNSNLPS